MNVTRAVLQNWTKRTASIMAEIIPAVLEPSLAEIERKLATIRGNARCVQVDIVDGTFAPNRTWPYAEGSQEEFERIRSEEKAFPLWNEFDFEFDLMIAHPEVEATDWISTGAARVVIHSSSKEAVEACKRLQEYRKGEYAGEVGIALLPSATAEALRPFSGLYDYVQVMGIERVGFQHQPFDARSVELVQKLRAQFPNLPIQVDGAVNTSNARALSMAGATRLVIGSAIFASNNPAEALKELQEETNRR